MVNAKRWWRVQEKACWGVPPAHARTHTSAVRVRTAAFYEHRMQLHAQPSDHLAHCCELRSMRVRSHP
jgi:hypothetical protein